MAASPRSDTSQLLERSTEDEKRYMLQLLITEAERFHARHPSSLRYPGARRAAALLRRRHGLVEDSCSTTAASPQVMSPPPSSPEAGCSPPRHDGSRPPSPEKCVPYIPAGACAPVPPPAGGAPDCRGRGAVFVPPPIFIPGFGMLPIPGTLSGLPSPHPAPCQPHLASPRPCGQMGFFGHPGAPGRLPFPGAPAGMGCGPGLAAPPPGLPCHADPLLMSPQAMSPQARRHGFAAPPLSPHLGRQPPLHLHAAPPFGRHLPHGALPGLPAQPPTTLQAPATPPRGAVSPLEASLADSSGPVPLARSAEPWAELRRQVDDAWRGAADVPPGVRFARIRGYLTSLLLWDTDKGWGDVDGVPQQAVAAAAVARMKARLESLPKGTLFHPPAQSVVDRAA